MKQPIRTHPTDQVQHTNPLTIRTICLMYLFQENDIEKCLSPRSKDNIKDDRRMWGQINNKVLKVNEINRRSLISDLGMMEFFIGKLHSKQRFVYSKNERQYFGNRNVRPGRDRWENDQEIRMLKRQNEYKCFGNALYMQIQSLSLYINFQQSSKMSVQAPLTERSLNRRELYKSQKLQEISQIYICQCGKNYLTFSALYLHSRNKHSVKLSTKRTTSNCRVENVADKIIVTYFIQQKVDSVEQAAKDGQSSVESQKLNEFQVIALIQQYVEDKAISAHGQQKYRRDVFEQLINYFTLLSDLRVKDSQLQIQNIPLYFNDFIIYYLQLSNQQYSSHAALMRAERELIIFWKWLRESKHVDSQLLLRTHNNSIYY